MIRYLVIATIAVISIGMFLIFDRVFEKQKLETEILSINERLEKVVYDPSISEPEEGGTIEVHGYWAKDTITISLRFEGEVPQDVRETATRQLHEIISSTNSTSGQYPTWGELLSELRDKGVHVPVARYTDDFENADIQLTLTDERHPENAVGVTNIAVNKQTKEIVWVQMKGYMITDVVRSDLNLDAFKHGVGHAMGLGHSNDPNSIMYPLLIIQDGKVYGKLGACEVSAMEAMYVDKEFEVVRC